MKIALAQLNMTVGDLLGNSLKIIKAIEDSKAEHVDLVIFSELALVGYPPKDLLLKPALIDECELALHEIAGHCEGIAAIVGYPGKNTHNQGRPLVNAAALLAKGNIQSRHIKSLLPTYDVFDESRYFEPGPRVDVTEFQGLRLGISICEDLWNDADLMDRRLYHDNPIEELAADGADLFINCSASPFVVGKQEFREQLFKSAAKTHHLPLVYVNQVGGNDELVFDGNSCVVNASGEVIARAKDFEEDLLIVDLSLPGDGVDVDSVENLASLNRVESYHTEMGALYRALVLGLRDYLEKCGFKRVVLGLSGGIDSAVVACIAAAAIGAENVTGIAMPSRYSSEGSKDDARILAERLGVKFHQIAIQPAHLAMEEMLKPYFKDLPPGVAEENIQARLRGLLLMSFSNKFGDMLLTTGNKSELAVGYCTLYGDMCGGLAVISDVPKTMVYDLARWMNTPDCSLYDSDKGVGPIPVDTITKPPSAELRPDQKDEDSLPPYEVLDVIVDRYIEREQSVWKIVEETGYEEEMVKRFARLIDLNEYKRKQAAPGIKITGRAFGFGRRAPIAQRYRGYADFVSSLRSGLESLESES